MKPEVTVKPTGEENPDYAPRKAQAMAGWLAASADRALKAERDRLAAEAERATAAKDARRKSRVPT